MAARRDDHIDQIGGDADDFAHRPLAAALAAGSANRTPSALAQVSLQAGVVELGGGDGAPEAAGARPAPASGDAVGAGGTDLVGHRDVAVQAGVPGAGVAMGEQRRR